MTVREDLSISLLEGHEILFCWGTWASLLLKDMKFWDRSWTEIQCSCCTLVFGFFFILGSQFLNGAKEARASRGRFRLNWRLFWAKEARASLGRFRLNWQLFSSKLINVSPVAWIWQHHHHPQKPSFLSQFGKFSTQYSSLFRKLCHQCTIH